MSFGALTALAHIYVKGRFHNNEREYNLKTGILSMQL